MSAMSKSTEGPPIRETNARNFNSTDSVADKLYSLLDEVDNESIADEFEISRHSPTYDFDNHIKFAVHEGDVLERVQNVEVTDENGTRQIRDERIELAETGETFRRVVLETPDGEEIEYLTTPASSAYDPIDVISICTLRTVIEVLFRELKQYLIIENFHSRSLNDVLFERFAALIGLVLIDWLWQHHPMRGGVSRTIQKVRTHWNKSLDSFG